MFNRKSRIIISICLCMVTILVTCFSAFAAGCDPYECLSGEAQVNASALNMRSSCSTSAPIIHVLYDNEWITYYTMNRYILSGWDHVHHSTYAGFVVSQYLDNRQPA